MCKIVRSFTSDIAINDVLLHEYVCTGADPGILERGGPVRGEAPNRAPKARVPEGGLGASPRQF